MPLIMLRPSILISTSVPEASLINFLACVYPADSNRLLPQLSFPSLRPPNPGTGVYRLFPTPKDYSPFRRAIYL